MALEEKILNIVTEGYLNSSGFNGVPIYEIAKKVGARSRVKILKPISSLVQDGKISLNFGDLHPNPHIKAIKEEPIETQLEKLGKPDDYNRLYICVYPTTEHMKGVVDPTKYKDTPFELRLALAEPQLSFLTFDLSVLEFYRNDPRYYYTNNDVVGTIYIRSEHEKEIPEKDQMFLDTFGFSYNSDYHRAVAVFLRYLRNMPPRHQQIWNAKLLEGDYKLHPDYYKANVLGSWDLGMSVFDAFLSEIRHINAICRLIGRPPLFLNESQEGKRPNNFGLLIRPTLKEYNDFIHLLDKLLSESINRDFFLNEVPFEYDEPRKDGKIIVRQKGTIQILDDWLEVHYHIPDRTPIVEMINSLKEVRKLRQHPAHTIQEDNFDEKYIAEQRDIITKTYKAIRTLRYIFLDHPKAKGYKIPNHLESGTIWVQ